MSALTAWLTDRFLPAFLMAAGVTLLAGGLVSLGTTSTGTGLPVESGAPAVATEAPWITLPDSSAGAGADGTTGGRVATRVVIPSLEIDLPVVAPQGADDYPLCDVAMYIRELGQPGGGRATYLYAHAREGMFLPLLTESRIDRGEGMVGALVEVYTDDDRLFLYEISEVRPHQLTLDDAAAAATEQLWLQTSEGPKGTKPKLQVVATFLSSGPADHAAAHPRARPRACE